MLLLSKLLIGSATAAAVASGGLALFDGVPHWQGLPAWWSSLASAVDGERPAPASPAPQRNVWTQLADSR